MENSSERTIFISYAEEDREIVARLRDRLREVEEAVSACIWPQPEELQERRRWEELIGVRLRGSDLVLACVSEAYLQSEASQEAALADEQGTPIILVILERAEGWRSSVLGKYEASALPHDADPISEFANEEEGFVDLVQGVTDLLRQKQSPGEEAPNEESKTSVGTEDRVRFQTDQPSLVDQLNRRAIAQALDVVLCQARDGRLQNPTEGTSGVGDDDLAFMALLHGKWGSDKTTLLNLLASSLSENFSKPWFVVYFNAWKNQDSGPATWALKERFVQAVLNSRLPRPIRKK